MTWYLNELFSLCLPLIIIMSVLLLQMEYCISVFSFGVLPLDPSHFICHETCDGIHRYDGLHVNCNGLLNGAILKDCGCSLLNFTKKA